MEGSLAECHWTPKPCDGDGAALNVAGSLSLGEVQCEAVQRESVQVFNPVEARPRIRKLIRSSGSNGSVHSCLTGLGARLVTVMVMDAVWLLRCCGKWCSVTSRVAGGMRCLSVSSGLLPLWSRGTHWSRTRHLFRGLGETDRTYIRRFIYFTGQLDCCWICCIHLSQGNAMHCAALHCTALAPAVDTVLKEVVTYVCTSRYTHTC